MSVKTTVIALDLEGIDHASEAVETFLASSKLDRRSQLSARLTFETALLNLRDTFGDGYPAELLVGSRLGKPRLVVKVRGRRFDPRELGDENGWEHSLMEAAGLRPSYAYNGGHNIIAISCPRPPMGSTLKAIIAIALGLLLSRTGFLLPDATRESILTGLIQPLFDTYVKMLAGVAGPMVFLSVACGITGIGDMVALGRSGKTIMGRHLAINFVAIFVAFAIGIPVFHLAYGANVGEGGALATITNLILGMVPTNFVEPVVENNTLQLAVLSIAVSIAALALGDLTEQVRKILQEINMLVQFLMEQLCRLLPAFIVVMMIMQSWSGTIGALLSTWLPVLLFVGTILLFLVAQLLVTSVKCKVPFMRLVRAIFPAAAIAFVTASSSAAFGPMLSVCQDDLGINEEQSSFGVPLGMVLCKPIATIQLAIVLLYAAQAFGVQADFFWYVRLGISCLLYAIAIPPVPGGTLACYGIMLASLGIPLDAVAVVTALDLLLDNFCMGGNVSTVVLEILLAANSLGAVDHERLVKEA